jgi:hypothetical protein
MKLCVKDKCKRCDIGYIIKDYLKPLMQVITVNVREYNMRLIQSKCLNTAVMFMYLFFGDKALKHTTYCDVANVVTRHRNFTDNSATIASKLQKDILRKTDNRYVYYIMLTDGYFEKPGGQTAFFPGHVFVIEKIPEGDHMTYYLYQSYIDQYSFSEYVDTYKSIRVSSKKVNYYMNKINDLVTKRVWDADFVKFWKDMTKVDTSQMLGGVPKDAFFVCYRKVKYDHCVKNLLKFADRMSKLVPKGQDHLLYGTPEMFEEDAQPLTNGQIKESLESLKILLKNNIPTIKQ